MTIFGRFLLCVMIAAVGLFTWAHGEARADPIVRTAQIGFRDWPKGAPPVRVVLASDIHLGNETMDVPRLDRIVAQIDAIHPDLILLAGDFVAGHNPAHALKAAAAIVRPLSALRARQGVIAVLGNHDEDTDPVQIDQALTRAGIRVLRNDAARVGALTIVGIGDRATKHADIPRSLAAARAVGGMPIAVGHGDVRSRLHGAIQLLLVGHTHCNQISLAPYGLRMPYVSPGHACGLVRDASGVTITTAGLGTSVVPLRLNAPPDLWLLTLGPAAG
jgi:predicted MPP superfamily phosphohydrolase